jgi:23S rRNA pseudouridine1911/1915/1917 synthase
MVEVSGSSPDAPTMNIIYEDEDVVAVNKPAGVVVFSENKEENSVAQMLSEKIPELNGVGEERKGAVHRLDKDTSGVVLFAKNNKALSFLQQQFQERKVKKKYLTLVFRVVKKDKGKIESFLSRSPKDRRKQRSLPDKGKKAVTFFKVVKRFENFTLLLASPKTGRMHQIRCHFASLGHPVVGDKLYCFKDLKTPKDVKRQLLHALSVKIKTPSGKNLKVKANIPVDIRNKINNLKKY